MQELGKAKIIVSGSSSKLLAGELATVLTGRHLDVFVFPLSFEEFLYFKNLEITDELDDFDDILTKDIEKRYKLKKSEKLRALARFYFTNISTEDCDTEEEIEVKLLKRIAIIQGFHAKIADEHGRVIRLGD